MNTLTDLQTKTLKVLIDQHSKNNPITGKQLAVKIDLRAKSASKQGADMRSVINALRSKGYPICASGSGYWYPNSQEELSKYIHEFSLRIQSQTQALEGITRGFDKIGRSNVRVPKVVIDPITRTVRYEQQPLF